MPWAIRYSEQYESWWTGLHEAQQEALTARIQLLAEHGPNLGRPTVDSVVGTDRHHNLNQWNRWYAEMIPVAEDLYDQYLRDEGLT